jgi:hypothetical protein
MAALLGVLNSFQAEVNGSLRARKITAGWSSDLFVECADTGVVYGLRIDDGALRSVEERGPAGNIEVLMIRGQTDLLRRVFSKQTHPLAAFTAGDIEIYGPQRDQAKLDAVSLVIWGA